MNARTAESIARSLDATPDLLPFLPELLGDLFALGSSPEQVVAVLAELGFQGGGLLLDAGCGKGAVSILAAARLGAQVTGVEAMAPFVAEARRRAAEHGVAARCRFLCADLRAALPLLTGFDAAMLLGLGPVLGGPRATVAALRACVRPGGLILIDDGYLADSSAASSEGPLGHEPTLAALVAHGDELLREVVEDSAESARRNAAILAAIRRSAERLADAHPADRERILGYVTAQERATAREETEFVNALWCLRRGP